MNRISLQLILLLILVPSLSYSESRRQPLVSFEENDLFGFKNKTGKVIIPPQYSHVFDFNEKKVAFVLGKDGWSCIDSNNKHLLSPFIFDNGPDYLSEGMGRFVEKGKIGFFDSACKKKIKADYDFAQPFENKFSIVCNGCYSKKSGEHSVIKGGKYGAIDKKGKIVVSLEYDSVSIDVGKKTAQVTNDGLKKEIKIR
ncbi:WG repeat-containing protein [Leptospira ilyithenensis]|uniref:WG repeat-containing protein n=1 Tax=Leptospira ilyithenensis TaxID=2484901 RepID=A0A4R9LNJ1_9LEPT|nr:WG repeat-containing protein [Leptospira ilyithenensis]TGN10389.1 WG repeat-containing protein [Leptospira ilyithenensis]